MNPEAANGGKRSQVLYIAAESPIDAGLAAQNMELMAVARGLTAIKKTMGPPAHIAEKQIRSGATEGGIEL